MRYFFIDLDNVRVKKQMSQLHYYYFFWSTPPSTKYYRAIL